jgi:large subunit ribosomal protein L35
MFFSLFRLILSNQISSSKSSLNLNLNLLNVLPISKIASIRFSSTVPRAVMKLKRGGGAMKTKSAVKKRFRVNGAGTLLRGQSGKRHLNEHKTRRKVNALGRTVAVTQPSIRKKYLRMLGM